MQTIQPGFEPKPYPENLRTQENREKTLALISEIKSALVSTMADITKIQVTLTQATHDIERGSEKNINVDVLLADLWKIEEIVSSAHPTNAHAIEKAHAFADNLLEND